MRKEGKEVAAQGFKDRKVEDRKKVKKKVKKKKKKKKKKKR